MGHDRDRFNPTGLGKKYHAVQYRLSRDRKSRLSENYRRRRSNENTTRSVWLLRIGLQSQSLSGVARLLGGLLPL